MLQLGMQWFSRKKKNSNGSLQSTADKNVVLDIANQIKRPIGVCYGKSETGLSLVA